MDGTMPIPELAAAPADTVVDSIGVNVHDVGPYTSFVSVGGALAYLGIRHARTGRVNVGSAGQRQVATTCANNGVGLIAIPDDFGNPTPTSRMNEALGQWGSVIIEGWEGPNEPNNGINNPSAWPATISTNGPTSTDLTLGTS